MLFATLVVLTAGVACAGEAEMKNGTILRGRIKEVDSIRNRKYDSTGNSIHHVIAVDTGWKTCFFPERQLQEGGLRRDAVRSADLTFEIPQIKTGRSLTVSSVGSVLSVEPWSAFGRRTVFLQTAKQKLTVVQGITQLTPDYAQITGLTHSWQLGMSLSQIPAETTMRLLHSVTKPTDAQGRLAIVRFCILAELYPQAFAELDKIEQDFPDLTSRVDTVRSDLLSAFGRNILRELVRRRDAGQHVLAEEHAQKIPRAQLAAPIQRDVDEFLQTYADERAGIEKIRLVLGDLQASLSDGQQQEALAALRSEISAELSSNTLPRLEPFIRSLEDRQLTASDKLALAYSGWMVGAGHAITSLPETIGLFAARHAAQQYLRDPASQSLNQTLELLASCDGVDAARLQWIVQQMSPPRAGLQLVDLRQDLQRIELAEAKTPIVYHVALPLEYSPERNYPAIVVLRPVGRTVEQMGQFWAGTASDPGWARRKGYIVVLPEYLEDDEHSYNYSIVSHERILGALRDARSRFAIDASRVFLTGHDQGGDATFDIALSHPSEFAGLIPICGRLDQYAKHYLENGAQLGWYVVGGEIDRRDPGNPHADRMLSNADQFDRICIKGAKFDFLYVEYQQRGLESFADELPSIFDWMELHRRKDWPREFEMTSLRKTDSVFYWLQAHSLPRHVLLPVPPGARGRNQAMTLSGRIVGANKITVRCPGPQISLWLNERLVQPGQRCDVSTIKGSVFRGELTPSMETLLIDQALRHDREFPLSIRVDLD